MKNKYFINSIFLSHEGEGQYVGIPQIFVRFQGCSIGCRNCDTKEALTFFSVAPTSKQAVLNKIMNLKIKRVSITGGDPLDPCHRPAVLELVKALKRKKYFINIEAAGTIVDSEIFSLVDSVSFDLKTPSAKIKTSLAKLKSLLTDYPPICNVQIKSVIESKEDFLYTLAAYKKLNQRRVSAPARVPWVLTPAYGPGITKQKFLLNFAKIFDWNLTLANGAFRVIGQQHKWVYGRDKKLV